MDKRFDVVGLLDNWKKGDLPGNQLINITISRYTKLENGSISITPGLSCDEEIDYEIDLLIRDLEFVRKKAKENIEKTNKKIRSI